MMVDRGIQVAYESIRKWCRKFAEAEANKNSPPLPQTCDRWLLGEDLIKINGKSYYLWRAVDRRGRVIDILMQRRQDEAAADNFLRKTLKPQECPPRAIVTDKLKSCGASKKKLLKGGGNSTRARSTARRTFTE
ncbi:DDE-type integrase/transposase/recombinase [Rubidibacter lacunae]|uniref:DDE-type integrase/transposase/recombinase n=1 Tax=Rubidibacter lacunae TaxID=582514 RepID=UPI0018DC5AC2|nr:DDE-type integrase/transposase/recombinase [Rubidibacter lacunae]